MGDFPTKFLIDGIDRLGKSTLIKNILRMYGYHLVIHYDKPLLIDNYVETAKMIQDPEVDSDYKNLPHLDLNKITTENLARYLYQEETNGNMFELMKTDVPIIFDRTHLGELVYAPLYRGYSGEYVYEFEEKFIEEKKFTQESNVRLILLTSSNMDMIQDDGLSFDFSKKEDEQRMFVEAFNQSRLTNKIIVDVHNGNGGYKSFQEVFDEAMHK